MKNKFPAKWSPTCNLIWGVRIWPPFISKLYEWTKKRWKSTSTRRAFSEIISCVEFESWAIIPFCERKKSCKQGMFVCLSKRSEISIPESAPDRRFSLQKCTRVRNQPLRIRIWAQFHSKADEKTIGNRTRCEATALCLSSTRIMITRWTLFIIPPTDRKQFRNGPGR